LSAAFIIVLFLLESAPPMNPGSVLVLSILKSVLYSNPAT